MPRSTLTELGIDKLTPKKGKIVEVWDKKTPGFGVRVMPSGFKSYFVMFRLGAKQRRLTLGRADPDKLKAVRKQAEEMLDAAKKGHDPALAIAEKRGNTFERVAEDYIREHVATLESAAEVAATIRRELIPVWRQRAIADLSAQDAAQLIRAIKTRGNDPEPGKRKRASGGPWAARKAFAAGSHLFNWAIGQHAYGITVSPFDRLEPKVLIGKKLDRDRVLDDREIAAVWQAADAMSSPYREVVQMLMLSGQRLRDIAEMSWSEVDLDKRLITIPAARMKGDTAHVIPMSVPMLAILKSIDKGERGDFVFSTTQGLKPFAGFSIPKVRLDAKIAEIMSPVPGWVLHDIRRTFRTGLSMLRVVDRVAELCIAHRTQGLHKVYDQHKYIDERREAMEAWAAKLAAILNPPPPNVVKLTRKV
jgi:integrase